MPTGAIKFVTPSTGGKPAAITLKFSAVSKVCRYMTSFPCALMHPKLAHICDCLCQYGRAASTILHSSAEVATVVKPDRSIKEVVLRGPVARAHRANTKQMLLHLTALLIGMALCSSHKRARLCPLNHLSKCGLIIYLYNPVTCTTQDLLLMMLTLHQLRH
jgi:hypothetical protein